MTVHGLKNTPFAIKSPDGFVLHHEGVGEKAKESVEYRGDNVFSVQSEISPPHLTFALPENEDAIKPDFPLLSFQQLHHLHFTLEDLLVQHESSGLLTMTPSETKIGNLKAYYLTTKFYRSPAPANGYSPAETFFRVEYMFDYKGEVYSCYLITTEESEDKYNPVFEKFCHSIHLKRAICLEW
jgi:hypothetical protein